MILFSIWTVISTIIDVYYRIGKWTGVKVSVWDVIASVLAISCIELILMLVVGFFAIAEGRGKHRNGIYIVLGIIVTALAVYDLISYITMIPYFYESDGLLRVIISIAVEATVIYASLDLVISAIKIRKLLKGTGAQTSGQRGE